MVDRQSAKQGFCYPSGGHRKDLSSGWSGTELQQYESWNPFKLARYTLCGRRQPTPLTNPVTLALHTASPICYIVTYSGENEETRPEQRGLGKKKGRGREGTGGSATHGPDLKRLLRERSIVWTGLQGTSLTSQSCLRKKTCHQKLSLASQGSSVMIVFGL